MITRRRTRSNTRITCPAHLNHQEEVMNYVATRARNAGATDEHHWLSEQVAYAESDSSFLSFDDDHDSIGSAQIDPIQTLEEANSHLIDLEKYIMVIVQNESNYIPIYVALGMTKY